MKKIKKLVNIPRIKIILNVDKVTFCQSLQNILLSVSFALQNIIALSIIKNKPFKLSSNIIKYFHFKKLKVGYMYLL